jgi:hypothetical protein
MWCAIHTAGSGWEVCVARSRSESFALPPLPPLSGSAAQEDAAVFFGREAQIVRGLDRLRSMSGRVERMFVILRTSGAGKSSICALACGRDSNAMIIIS